MRCIWNIKNGSYKWEHPSRHSVLTPKTCILPTSIIYTIISVLFPMEYMGYFNKCLGTPDSHGVAHRDDQSG